MRAKHSTQRIRSLRRRRLALALVAAMAAPVAMAQDLPTGASVVNGSATIGSNGSEMTITQNSQGTIINWGTFNISNGYSVNFAQPNSSSVVLNRVLGTLGSNIDGVLTANGHVFIVNTNGITFGGNSQVNVGGLVASTLAINNTDFLTGVATGRYRFAGTTNTPTLRNDGDIVVGAGGLAFVGTALWNSGDITANGGNIAFGAGDAVTVDFVGDGLTQVTLNARPVTTSAIVQDRFGSMTADGGAILLRTATTAGGSGGSIFASGTLRARTMSNVAGRIELTSNGGLVVLGAPGFFSDANSPFTIGTIDVSGNSDERGGSVLISGGDVLLVNSDSTPFNPSDGEYSSSRIYADGGLGGGNVTISSTGDITMLAGTLIDASSTYQGNGGNINIFANGGDALLYGSLYASGGDSSGNGGRVQVVAQGNLVQDGFGYYGGTIDVGAEAGNGGQIVLAAGGYLYADSLTAYGGVNGGSITAQAASGIAMYGDIDAHGQAGNGGSISLTSQGAVYVNGSLDASGALNGGSIALTGTAVPYSGYYYYGGILPFGDPSAVYVSGLVDASGGSGNGGSVTINGYGEVIVYSSIYASGGVDGGQITLNAHDGPYYAGSMYVDGFLDASGTTGNGGTIHVASEGDVVVYGDLLAWGGVDGGDITVAGADVYVGSLLAYGNTGMGGSVGLTADNIAIYGFGTYIDVHGETGGGAIDLYARDTLVLSQDASLSADTGSSGLGGSIRLFGGNGLIAYGDLSARGVDGGGSIYTGSGGGIDLDGINVDAGTVGGVAGTWTIAAPQLTVVNGANQGFISEGYYAPSTSNIQDNDLNNAFATGTNIVLNATNGSVDFDAPQVMAAFSSPLFLQVNATGAITGSGFSIASSGGALDMLFNANSGGGNGNGGYIDFVDASLYSNGGLIALYGQSDLAGGFASGFASGISLAGVDIDSGGGDVLLRGHSAGTDAGSTDAGVYLDGSDIYSGGGNVEIHGTGAGDTNGVYARFSSISSDGGDIDVFGQGGSYDGIRMLASDMDSGGGDIALYGYGGDTGIDAAYSSLYSAGGNINAHGEGGTGNGITLDGAVDSGGGNIALHGYSAGAIGLLLDSGSGIVSGGGDIDLYGAGLSFGVAMHAYAYGGYTFFLPSDIGTVNSGGGELVVTGTATAVDAVGVYLDGMQLIGGAGNVTVDGSAPLGTGVAFANGAGIITTTGAITVIGEGANIGLDLDFGDGALQTDSGDIALYGYALAATSSAGVRLVGAGLYTNGGDITIHGESAGGAGVQLGDSGGFVIDTGGGDISVSGYGATTGVDAPYAGLYSGGGTIAVHGEGGTGNGVSLSGPIDSDGGDIDLYGTSASAIGLAFGGYGSGIVSAGGDISLVGIGQTGGVDLYAGGYGGYTYFLPSDAGTINSGGGQLTITGTAYGADAIGVHNDGMQLIGGAGNVTVEGFATLGIGILFENGAAISTTTGNIRLHGEGADLGLDIEDGVIDTDSGDIALYGYALAPTSSAGVRLAGAGLYTNGGDITIHGESAGGAGVQLGDSGGFVIDTGGGDISVSGYGATTGVDAPYAGLYSGGGTIAVHGEGGTGNGVSLSGPIDSDGGDIDLYGTSASAIGLAFGGYGSGIVSAGGDISLVGIGQTGGVALYAGSYNYFGPSDIGTINSGGGQLTITGTAYGADAIGVHNDGMHLISGAGDLAVTGTALSGTGIAFLNGADATTTSGAITLRGRGAQFGLDLDDSLFATDSGDIILDGRAYAANATAGVRMAGSGLTTHGGGITVYGNSAGGTGVQLGDGGAFSISSGGGEIILDGTGVGAGVVMRGNLVDTGGGDLFIDAHASGAQGTALDMTDAHVDTGTGRAVITGHATGAGSRGVLFGGQASVSSSSGSILMIGIGDQVGLMTDRGEIGSDSGYVDVRGRGVGANSSGLLVGAGTSIHSGSGGVELAGEGGSGAGLHLAAGSSIDAGGLVVLHAGNDGSSDAIRLQGSIHSGVGVNLRAGGVQDGNGGLYERADDRIVLGAENGGFSLSASEIALIDAPELVIGSALHAGAIQVLGAVSRNGNLTLQNDAGSGGIAIQAALNAGGGTLALSSGGSITQASAGVITAHSLLARAGGDVLLANAQNNVASTTLAGSAGGNFEFLDVDTLAIGTVSGAVGIADYGLTTLSATGIQAGGNVFVRNLAGDLTLNAGVSGNNIDLVTAGRLQNLAGASLLAQGNWRVWANTWEGETRGGLAGSGNLPNLYGCTFQGSCGVTVPATDNHFIYVQQPTAVITFDSFTREYGLPNPLLTFSVTGAILGDTAANVATGTATTTATIGSDVGNYPITGVFTSAAGYRIQLVPGTLGITPATLFFTADGAIRYLGTPNPPFSGTVTGFRNGDTVESVFGSNAIWSSPAGLLSPVGFYAINGGTTARNYVFVQAPGNATALQIIPLPQLSGTPTQIVRETVDSYVYDRNFGSVPMCALNASLEDQQLASKGDELSTEWSKVRSRPNLTNCFESERRNSCGDF